MTRESGLANRLAYIADRVTHPHHPCTIYGDVPTEPTSWQTDQYDPLQLVTTLGFTGLQDNLPLDTCPNNGGKRIFPGKKTLDDDLPERRRKVWVTAKMTRPISGVPVYFKSWDVDEPGTDEQPIDTNGNDSGGDNRGSPNNGMIIRRYPK